jgi:hypothetical protein
MLNQIGLKTLDELTQKAVPAQIRTQNPLQVGPERGETELLKDLKATAQQNKLLKNFIGMGYYGTITPNGKFFFCDRFARDLTNGLTHVPIIFMNYAYYIIKCLHDSIFFLTIAMLCDRKYARFQNTQSNHAICLP